ncbi:hypothetical protein MI353_16405, partial [Alteromonas sp. MCA-1]|nr:hypothetical protein [Alteromonas sp. MCA-1]
MVQQLARRGSADNEAI